MMNMPIDAELPSGETAQLFDRFAKHLEQRLSVQLEAMKTELGRELRRSLKSQTVEQVSSSATATQEWVQLNDYGVQLFFNNQGEQAAQILEESVKANSDAVEAWYNLGVVYCALQLTEKSVSAFQQAAVRDPGRVEVLNGRGVLALIELKPEKALELFEQTGSESLNQIDILLNTAQAYEMLDNHDMAIRTWRKVIAIDPNQEEANQFLRQYYQS